MSDYSTIYSNNDAQSMLKWREKDADPYFNLIRNSNQLLFLNKLKSLKKPLRILEYGCAFADLIAMIKFMNPAHEVFAVEKVAEVAKLAEARLGKRHIFTQSIEKPIPLESGSVDLIFSFDVIEHVKKSQVRGMLRETNRLLKKNGLAIIVTPNCNILMKAVYIATGNRYLIDKSFHINQYTAKRLKKEVASELRVLAQKQGYDLTSLSKLLSVFGIYKHLCIVAGKRPENGI